MRTIVLCLTIGLFAFPNVCTARDLWTSLGPEGGAVSSMAIDPQNPSILYVGTDSGRIFKSLNGGDSWSPTALVENRFDFVITVASLAIDPKNPATVYAGAGFLFKSTDGGTTWSRSSDGITGSLAKVLTIDPINPSTLYVGTYTGGIFKTTNAGVSWTAVNNGLSALNVTSLAIDPKNSNVIYAGMQGNGGGLYKSVDAGASWNAIGMSLDVIAISIDPVNSATVYAVQFGGAGVYSPPALLKSTDGGSSWSDITAPWQLPGAIAIDSLRPSTLYVAGYSSMNGDAKSTDGGANWIGIGIDGIGLRSFYINPQDTALVYALTDRNGIYRSTDGGQNWSSSNTGLNAMAVRALTFDPRDPSALYAAGQSSILKRADGSGNWTDISINFGSPIAIGTSYLTLDPQIPSVLYGGSLYKTANGGISWNRLNLNSTVLSLAVDPQNPAVLYAATYTDGVLKSTSGGAAWSAANNGLPTGNITALAIDPKNTATLYAGVPEKGLFKSTDGGASWYSPGTMSPGTYLQSIVVSPQDTRTLFAVSGSRLLRSTDAGGSWSDSGLYRPTSAIAIDLQRPSDVYAGTYRGVYRSTDGGIHWMLMTNGLSEMSIRALAIDPVGRRIYAGTSNQGVWVAPLDITLDFHVNPWGATTVLTSGAGEIRTGYADLMTDPANAPYATAVFTFRQNGTVVSEAGVPASKPTTSARIFVDYRDVVQAVPSRSDAGYVDIRTGIAVVNYSSEKANIVYTLRDPFGNTVAVGQGKLDAWHHVACFIDRLSDCAVANFNLPPDFQSAIKFGSLDISGDQPLSVLALRGIFNQREEFLLTTTPVADLTQAGSAYPLYFPQFVDGSGYTTSLILLNTSNASESGTLQIKDKNGNPLTVVQAGSSAGSSFRYSIAPNGLFHFQTDGSAGEIRAGWVRLVPDPGSEAPVGSGIFGYNPQNVLVSESGIPSAVASTKAYMFVDLSENHNTGLAISNTVDVESSITIKAYGSDGITNIVSTSDSIPLAAGGYVAGFVNDFLKGLPAGFTGVLDVSSTAPFAALTLRSLVNKRGEFLMTTFPVVARGGTAPTPIIFPHIANGGGYTTQFVFLSAGAAVDAGLILYDESGEYR